MRVSAVVLLLMGLVLPARAAIPAGGRCEWLNGYIGRTYTLRPSVNTSPYVYLAIGEQFATLEMAGPIFPLLLPEPITIRDVELDVDDGVATMDYRTGSREKGKLYFVAPQDAGESMGQVHVDGLLALVSEEGGVAPHVLNAETHMLHYKGSNHAAGFPPGAEFHSPGEALAAGHRLCPSCFAPINLLPGYDDELKLGMRVASEVRATNPASTDARLQERIKAVGERVLANWPLPLRGYSYRFSVIEAVEPNAVACPGGWVFVTDGLLALCESDQELEAIVAHEISHVELRHGLRQMQAARRTARVGALVGVLGAGIAASQGDAKTAQVVGELGMLVVAVASELALSGYSRELESESDAAAVNYLVHASGAAQRVHLAHILAKLEYLDQCKTGQLEQYSGFDRHPASSVRADFALHAATSFYPEPLTFTLPTSDGGSIELRISGMFHHAYHEPVLLARYEDMTGYEFGFPGGGSRRGVSNRARSDTRIFAVVVADENVPRDAEFRDVEVMIDGTWWRFDNREDTSLYPGAATSVSLVHRQHGLLAVKDLDPTQLRLGGRISTSGERASQGLR